MNERGEIERRCVINRAMDKCAKFEGNSLLNGKPVKCGKALSRRFGVKTVSGDDSSKSVLSTLEAFDVVSRDAVEETVCIIQP